jgi:hypothetical protein
VGVAVTDLYGEEFFREMNEGREAYRRLAACIWQIVFPDTRSVVDLGCGSGLVLEWIQEHRPGVHVHGVDLYGQSDNVFIESVDLTNMGTRWDADLVICTETAEHLPESAADGLVEVCCDTAKRQIVFSAAPPGQEGTGHINCQPIDYWLSRFAARGWAVDPIGTAALQTLMVETHAQHEYCAGNFVVLEKAGQ